MMVATASRSASARRPAWMRGWVAVMALVLGMVVTLPMSAAAAGSLLFHVVIGQCFIGEAPASASVHVVWKDGAGHTLKSFTVAASGTGSWHPPTDTCSSRKVKPLDRIRATVAAASLDRTFKVRRLSVAFDRKTDVVSGHGPASSTLQVLALRFPLGDIFPTIDCPVMVATSASGAYHHDMTGCDGAGYDAAGGDRADVAWESPAGDSLVALGYAPWIRVTIGSPRIKGAVAASSSATIHLRKPNGVLRGTAHAHSNLWGMFSTRLHKASGDPARVRMGERIDGDWAGHVAFTVPVLSSTWDLTENTVVGHCMPNAPVALSVKFGTSTSSIGGTTDSNGDTLTLDTDQGFHDLTSGDLVTLICQRKSGDQIARQQVIP